MQWLPQVDQHRPGRITTTLAAAALITLLAGPVAMAQGASDGGTAEERQACMPDVFRLCQAEIPNRERIVACLESQPKALSPACRGVFAARAAATSSAATSSAARPHRGARKRTARTKKPGVRRAAKQSPKTSR